ncbi:PREDICTED: LOW QUALITY PROTEIN: pentraxin-related protein PTX3 [Dipodomys ordii]|uniref:LOW QUALITY PROTEIN: pentraxin-related protein PTX3 n=1 Tax=Dipodomys ordii TaxID=10020 RepID=A0A1S3F4S0_DIPOR|nr:PREDICTED: LOW QUALITY PROTEIN: pentraxin-related protein PTX3 [Dipodomys ordii]
MQLPALLLCALSAAAGAGPADDYELLYVNLDNELEPVQLPTDEPTPCDCRREPSEWDKLFTMLENSQMREAMLLEATDVVLRGEMQRLRAELGRLAGGLARPCTAGKVRAAGTRGDPHALPPPSCCDCAGSTPWERTAPAVPHRAHPVPGRISPFQNDPRPESPEEAGDGNRHSPDPDPGTPTPVPPAPLDLTPTPRPHTPRGSLSLRSGFPPLLILSGPCLRGARISPHYVRQTSRRVDPPSAGSSHAFPAGSSSTSPGWTARMARSARVSRPPLSPHSRPAGCEVALVFPMRSPRIFGSVHPVRPLQLRAFSACLWVRTSEVLNKTVLFSYSTEQSPRELQLSLGPRAVELVVGGEGQGLSAARAVAPGRWTHLCGTWASQGGRASLWADGQLLAAAAEVAAGHQVRAGGALRMGQEGGGGAGGVDHAPAFSGWLTGFNIWDRVLSEAEIREAGGDESCHVRGNVVGWGVTEILPHGGAQYLS